MSKNVTVGFKLADGTNVNHVFDLQNFTRSMGALIASQSAKMVFMFLGAVITVPKLTGTNDNRDRVLSFLRSMVAGFFGTLEVHQNLPASEVQKLAVLESLKKAGFKFSAPNKIEVSKAVEIWAKNKAAKKQVAAQIVTSMNLKTIAETNVLREVAKALKADNLAALTGFEKKVRTKIGYATTPSQPAEVEAPAES